MNRRLSNKAKSGAARNRRGKFMIRDDRELAVAQDGVRAVQLILQAARKVHPPEMYLMMSEPILAELRERVEYILAYLGSPISPARPDHAKRRQSAHASASKR